MAFTLVGIYGKKELFNSETVAVKRVKKPEKKASQRNKNKAKM